MNGRNDSFVRGDERVDDLQYKGLRLIQSPASFCFGTDSVLLLHFACGGLKNAPKKSRAVDLGAGSGVLSLLLNARLGLRVTAVELDAEQCGRLKRSLALNGLPDGEIEVVNADYLDGDALRGVAFDCAVCNPPYFRRDQGRLSEKPAATHETAADIGSIARAAARLIRYGGKLFICFPAARLSEALTALSAAGLEPKQLRLVQTNAERKPYLALIRTNRGAKPGLTVERNLIITGPDGKYTEEVEKYYRGD